MKTTRLQPAVIKEALCPKRIIKASKLFVIFPLLSLLPMGMAYRLCTLFQPLSGEDLENYVTGAITGIKKVLTGGMLPQLDLEVCMKENLEMLSMEIMDNFIVPGIHPERFSNICTITGLEHIQEALMKGRGLIVVTGHFNRLLMTPYAIGISGLGIRNLSQDISRKNPYLDWVDRIYLAKKVRRLYETSRAKGITLGENIKAIFNALGKNETIFILLDAYPHNMRKFGIHPFLGGRIKLATGIERISQRTRTPLVYSITKPDGAWRVRTEISPLEGFGHEAFAQAVKRFERDLANCPCQWWQWGFMNSMWEPGGVSRR